MNLLLFFVTIMVSFVVVRIGAIAFELTGLEWSLAKFQSLSCFSGTGFTTKEAELIAGHPQRRRIASVLMVLGNAGFVTLIATFANSLRPDAYIYTFTLPFLKEYLPRQIVPWANVLVLGLMVFGFYRLVSYSRLGKKLTDILRRRLASREIIKRVSFEELLVSTGGYGVSSIEIYKGSPLVNKTIQEAGLRAMDITVLTVERGVEVIPNPTARVKILLGDKLVCFGKLETIRTKLCKIPKA